MKTTTARIAAVALVLAGCSDNPPPATPALLGPVAEVGSVRPASVHYPDDYAAEVSYPLVVMLHGFGANATLQDAIFDFTARVTRDQFVLLTPDGTRDPEGDRFWNATHECCDFFNIEPDDVQYVSDLISDARTHFHIDPSRISLVGHSNGGYMANRYACEPLERVTRIVNLAGLSFVQADDCQRPAPVEVLHIHGTADDRVFYASNVTDPSLSNPDVVEDDDRLRAGAYELARRWAARAGCDPDPVTDTAAHDLSNDLVGDETDALVWPNCAAGSSTLLRANGVGHLWADASEELRQLIVDFVVQAANGAPRQ